MTTSTARLVAVSPRGPVPYRRGPGGVTRWADALRAGRRPTAAVRRRRGLLRDVVGSEVLAVGAMLAMLVATALV